MNDDTPRNWVRHASEPGPDLIICRARFDTLTNPRTDQRMRRLVLESPPWVNVVALTSDERLVIVRQYRFGTGEVTLEIPGGCVDSGEEPALAARRELREECGYTSEDWTPLGHVEPNPAFLDNRCYHFLARGVERSHPQELDGGEDIQVDTITLDEARRMVHDGEIRHSLVICALARVLDLS